MSKFSKLSPEAQAALTFIFVGIHNEDLTKKTLVKIKKYYDKKDWSALAILSNMMTDTELPGKEEFEQIGNMTPGLQNAQYFLCMLDMAPPSDTLELKEKFDTFCWDGIAEGLKPSATKLGISFTADDLHNAYAPGNNSPCNSPSPSGLAVAIIGIISAKEVLQKFFANSLPDFFTGEFTNFFTGSIPDFFTGQFAGFFTNIGTGIKDGFEDFGGGIKDISLEVGKGVEDAAKTVGDGVVDATKQVEKGVETAVDAVRDFFHI